MAPGNVKNDQVDMTTAPLRQPLPVAAVGLGATEKLGRNEWPNRGTACQDIARTWLERARQACARHRAPLRACFVQQCCARGDTRLFEWTHGGATRPRVRVISRSARADKLKASGAGAEQNHTTGTNDDEKAAR